MSVMQFGQVAVLMGGWSAERAISLSSGAAVLAALKDRDIDAHGVDVGRDLCQVLVQGGFHRAFNVVHGRGGEDGVLQGVLELLELPYTGSGVLASALTMNKIMTKQLWRAVGLPTPEAMVLSEATEPAAVVRQLGLPLIIKPALEGSSIGVAKVATQDQLVHTWAHAATLGGPVLAERWIEGREYTVGIIAGEPLPVIRLETPRAFYDYEAKYLATDTGYHCPCGLVPAWEQALQALALKAFVVTGATAWGRVDLMLDGHDAPWLIEVNTIPGMTDHSLLPMAARAAGLTFEDLVMRILASASLKGQGS